MRHTLLISLFLVLLQLNVNVVYGQKQKDSTKVDLSRALEFLLSQEQDSSFIQNLTDEVSVRLLAITKYNYIKIRDASNNSSILYRPDNRLNFGVGVTYKIFSVDLGFNVGLTQNREQQDEFENSKYFDFVGSLFTSRHYVELSYRYYYGHYLARSTGLTNEILSSSRPRGDIRSTFTGIEYLNALNFRKFSFKAPFVNNEIQRKSAGSVILGVSFGTSSIEADSSMIPPEVQSDFSTELQIRSIYLADVAINAGYGYSFVKNGWYITLSVIPGLAFVSGDYSTTSRTPLKASFSPRFKSMNAIGYSGRKFYGGLHLMIDILGPSFGDRIGVELTKSKAKLFFGYRFIRK